MRGKLILLFLLTTLLLQAQLAAEANLVVNRHNNFLTNFNYHPSQSADNIVVLSYILGGGIQFVNEGGSSIDTKGPSLDEGSAVPLALTLPALFYPNPFRLDEGAVLGYRLSRGDADISIRMYDMRGNEIFRKDITAGTPGAQLGYNKVAFNRSVLGHGNLPSGIYLYIVMSGGQVLGKGKVAVKP